MRYSYSTFKQFGDTAPEGNLLQLDNKQRLPLGGEIRVIFPTTSEKWML